MNEKTSGYTSYIIGGFLGALAGIIAAHIISSSPELDDQGHARGRKNLSRIGLKTIAMLWSLMDHGRGHQK